MLVLVISHPGCEQSSPLQRHFSPGGQLKSETFGFQTQRFVYHGGGHDDDNNDDDDGDDDDEDKKNDEKCYPCCVTGFGNLLSCDPTKSLAAGCLHFIVLLVTFGLMWMPIFALVWS